MTVITTRLIVAADGSISAADRLPQGEYAAVITVAEQPAARRSVLDLPVHRGRWDDSISLRREDMYGDDGRSCDEAIHAARAMDRHAARAARDDGGEGGDGGR